MHVYEYIHIHAFKLLYEHLYKRMQHPAQSIKPLRHSSQVYVFMQPSVLSVFVCVSA